jgi:hypothetical protein
MAVNGNGPSLKFHEGGCLFLAKGDLQVETMRQNNSVQLANNADVVLRSISELANAFPHLNVSEIKLAS